jgi:phosphoribosylformylglycinamidine synthase
MTFVFEVLGALPALGWTNVHDVHVGKHIRLTVDAVDEAAARDQVEEIARRLLSNPVIEEYRILETEEARGS